MVKPGHTLGLIVLLCALFWPAAAGAEDGWKLVTNRDQVKVFVAPEPGMALGRFRGETILTVRDFRTIAAVLDDEEAMARLFHLVSQVDVVERGSVYDRIVWLDAKLPWPVADREVVLVMSLTQDPDTYAVTVPFRSIELEQVREPRSVPVAQMEGHFGFQPIAPGRVRATLELRLDLGGRVPAWLANLMVRDMPYFALMELRRITDDERYQGVDLGYYRIPPGWPESMAEQGEAAPSVSTGR